MRWDQAAEEPAIDGSNLIFPHDVHVQQDGINGPYGKEVLGCDSCHQVEPGGVICWMSAWKNIVPAVTSLLSTLVTR